MFYDTDRDSESRVKRTNAIPPLRPEFDKFLYATMSEYEGEMPSSVLSALARQNLDPWEEAAKLARLPRESAVARLSSTILLNPGGVPAENATTAARLVALLPPARSNFPFLGALPGAVRGALMPIMIYLFVGALILASALLGF